MRTLLILVRNVALALAAALQGLWRRLIPSEPVEWVAFELDGLVGRGREEELPSLAWRLPRGTRIRTLAELRRALAILREVPTVRGIVVRHARLQCGGAVLRELRTLLADFRAAGKQVVFHAEHLDTRDYWLASVADRVWLTPRGRLDLVGFSAVSSAAAKPLARLGLSFQIIRAGVFKSAGELVGAEQVSDAQKQQLDDLVGDLAEVFAGDVTGGRGLTAEQLRAAIDAGPYTAKGALAAGLVDGLCYADEVRERLGADSGTGPRRARLGPFAAVFATHGAPPDWRPLRDRRPVVAVVDVEGIIASGKSRAVPFLASTAGSETLVEQLTRVRRDKRVKAVVLRIDSRGGSALASDIIWRAAKRLAAEKPVIAYLDDVAASGGYYIAAAAKRIIAAPTCITGSIGVFATRPDTSEAYRKLEVDHVAVKRGAHATLYRPDQPLSESERETLQKDVLETYGEFLDVVAEGRAMPLERVRVLAEGRVYLAPRALREGLVDVLGTLEVAVEEARVLAGIVGPARVTRIVSRQAGWRELVRTLRREGARATLTARRDPLQALWIGELRV